MSPQRGGPDAAHESVADSIQLRRSALLLCVRRTCFSFPRRFIDPFAHRSSTHRSLHPSPPHIAHPPPHRIMISALAFVPRGASKETPEQQELSAEEMNELIQKQAGMTMEELVRTHATSSSNDARRNRKERLRTQHCGLGMRASCDSGALRSPPPLPLLHVALRCLRCAERG